MVLELIGAIAGAGSFVLDVVKCFAAPIGRPFKYLYNYNTNFKNLEKEVTKLKNTREAVQVEVTAAGIRMEEIKQSVKDWQTEVNSTISEAERLAEEKGKNPRCFKGLRPNCITGYKHSKKAFKLKRDDIGPLLLQEEKFDSVSYPTIPLEKNFDKLRDDVLKLKNAKVKVQHKVKEAKNNVEEIEEAVKKWLEDVDSIIVEAEELIENQSSIGTDRKTRYQNSNAASELMVDNIGPLLQQGERFDKVSYPTIHKEIWLRSNEDYLAFESRNSTVKNVLDALHDEEIYMMGVYGMGGLGKTTLVQEIGRKAEKDKLFDEIVFVEVTETLDVKKIQTEIADKLGVKFNNQSERANKLYERLRNGKKILLILDNVWEDLDLKTIGIPSKTDRGGCKIMLTTRNLDVLQKMDSTSNFGMGILEEEEAWNLFMKMAENNARLRALSE
ncbi:probable disease resistance protein At1g61310 [Pistacia vera]|uniref:probable disease resistance protein At1g61310 n=1 Tax=Pistacia vera TaxID=55513 RepID=UPI0012635074|nr:probable disease resistance protein At1g61310 [Pistacia vera]